MLIVEHRGWRLQARWTHSMMGAEDGWICYASGPASSHELNLGRWASSDDAFDHGRAYVDRRLDAAALSGRRADVHRLKS